MNSAREALRHLLRAPGFSITVILSVALAVGLAGSVLSVVVATFFTPLPYAEPDRLVEIWQTPGPGSDQVQDYLQPQRIEEWASAPGGRSVSAIAGASLGSRFILERTDGPTGVTVRATVGDWFGVLGVDAARGRRLTASDESPAAAPAAVVSEAFLERWLPDGIGSVITVSGTSFTVVGVMTASFEPESVAWVPAATLPEHQRPAAYAGIARVRPGAGVADAKAEIQQMSAVQVAADSAGYGGLGATVRPMGAQARGPDKPLLWLLTGVVGAVLLMGLSNLTQIFLVHAQRRSAGLAVRLALGGTLWQVGRVLMAEALIAGIAGASLGVLFAHWGKSVARSLLSGAFVFTGEPSIGPPVYMMALTIGLLVALLVGVEPLRRLPAMNLQRLLQGRGGGSTSTPGERRTRDVMVIFQIALCLVLAAGGRVVQQTYEIISGYDMGYDAEHVVQAIPDYGLLQMEPDAQWAFVQQLWPRLAARPEIAEVVSWHHVGQDYPPRPESRAVTDGPDVELGTFDGLYSFYRVTPGFFSALGIPLVQGRGFEEGDRADTPLVAVVTRRGAESWWPDADPIGRQIKLGAEGAWLTVVGVAGDIQPLDELGRYTGGRERSRLLPVLFVPIEQMSEYPPGWRVYPGRGEVAIAGRASGSVDAAARALQEEAATVMPELLVTRTGTLHDLQMDGYLGRSIALTGGLVGAGVVVAMLLAALGIVGLVVEGLTRRKREIGLRMALGARTHEVVGLIAWDGVRMTMKGLALGAVLLVVVDRTVFRALFGYYVERISDGLLDPPVLLGAALFVAVVSIGASGFTARHAAAVDPSVALRVE